jgi:hypothetical protein
LRGGITSPEFAGVIVLAYTKSRLPPVASHPRQGYQADIDIPQVYTRRCYEERGRGFPAMRGRLTRIAEGKKPAQVGSLGYSAQLKGFSQRRHENGSSEHRNQKSLGSLGDSHFIAPVL